MDTGMINIMIMIFIIVNIFIMGIGLHGYIHAFHRVMRVYKLVYIYFVFCFCFFIEDLFVY